MTTHLHRLVFLGASLLVSCGGGSDDYEPPRLPPPPPPPPAPTVEATPLPEPYSQATPEVSPPSGSQQGATPPLPPSPPRSAGATPPPPPGAGEAVAPAPPPVPPAEQSQLVYSYPTGQWVYLSGQGWVWVPSGAAPLETDGVPYVYLYTPAYGWTWYVSPWGWGPYRYGLWVRHPWHPAGLHGYWVAHPRVVVRLGRRGHFRH
jgi:hypothetical protein